MAITQRDVAAATAGFLLGIAGGNLNAIEAGLDAVLQDPAPPPVVQPISDGGEVGGPSEDP